MSPQIDNLASANSIAKIQRFLQRHFYLLLLIPLFIIIIPIAKPGISITGDFPYLDSPDYAAKRLSMWIETGSIDGFEFLPRFPILGMWQLLGYLHLTTEIGTKAMIVLGFLLSSFSFYFSFLKYFQDRYPTLNLTLKISAVLGSIFYAYNVWSFNRVHHWYLWIGYVVFPIFFVSVLYSLKNPRDWKWIITSIFFWTVASSTPHMAAFYGISFIVTSLAFILKTLLKHERKENLIRLAIPIVVIIVFYVLVNMYWIYPYFLASKTGSINPNYEFTEENINLLSRYSNFLNTFRGLAYWINLEVIRAYDSTPFFNLWVGASFVVPVTAFSSIILKKSIKQSIIFSSVALLGILFAMGTRSPVNYYDLMLSTPVLDRFVWLLRDPDKMTFFIAFAYSFLLGLFSFKFLTRFIRAANKINLIVAGSFIILLVGSVSITAYPYYKARLAPLEPIVLPKEFDDLNKYLSSINPDRVYFVPYPLEETQWDQNGRVATIYQTHSIKPSIESTEYNLGASNYYNFFVNYVMNNKSKDVRNLLYPLGTSYLIFHNDSWSRTLHKYNPDSIVLLKRLNLLDDIKNVKDIGFYNVFKTSTINGNKSVSEVNIPFQNMLVLGGLDTYASLNSLTSFNSLQSSIQFSDNILSKNKNTGSQDFGQLILYGSPSYYDLALSLVGDKYIVVPTLSTIRDDPATAWSKSSTSDPINAEFHSRLRNLGMSNWDFDYGKGQVITKSMGVNMSIPVYIKDAKELNGNSKEETFQLFIRIFKNQKGGMINVYFDGKLISQVDTYDKISNNFEWVSLGTLKTAGVKHTLTLQNVAGFNAVNILAIIPTDEMARIKSDVSNLIAKNVQIAYLMEAESSFSDDKGNDTGLAQYLYKSTDNKSAEENKNTGGTHFEGKFSVPPNADLATIKFDLINDNNTNLNTSSSFANVNVYPSKSKHTIYSTGFERDSKISIPLGNLRQLDWINYDKDIVSTSLDSKNPLEGNYSLSVHIKPGQRAGWNTLSTDFIPISDDKYYNASLRVSTNDVSQLHSKALYFDSQKRVMYEGTEYISRAQDGTFSDNLASSLLPPLDAKFLKLQVLTLSDNPKPSSYVLDNVNLDEVSIPNSVYQNRLVFNLELKQHEILNSTSQLNYTDNSASETVSFTVKGGGVYRYLVTLTDNDLKPNSILVNFKNSSGVTKDTKYGTNASQGEILSLNSGSEIAGDLNILKASNYTVAIKAKVCETCTFLRADVVGKSDNRASESKVHTSILNLKANVTGLNWTLSDNFFLKPGAYKIKIYSDSHTDLDSVVVYSSTVDDRVNNKLSNDKLGLFSVNENPSVPYISSYKKINPTKHVVTIKQAVHPYMISLAESYDPLWTAYAIDSNNGTELFGKDQNLKVNSIPLYGVINGFYINKTGNYDLVIEYSPQKWFIQGSIVSTISVMVILLFILFVAKKEILRWPYRQIVIKMKQQW